MIVTLSLFGCSNYNEERKEELFNTLQYASQDYIDLGLPSGTLWATCNVGANKPEEFGDYYAWGETVPKTSYRWNNYKWCKGNNDTMTKYCLQSLYGNIDSLILLELQNDAAYRKLGGDWRMPTSDEMAELNNLTYCTWERDSLNSVVGYYVTSKINGNSIFLPAAGFRRDTILFNGNVSGYYWTSSLYTDCSRSAISLYFVVSRNWGGHYRYCGLPIRPVRSSPYE